MRGSHQQEWTKMTEDGIIPAHAGLTLASLTQSLRLWDHPRACGAHLFDGLIVH